MTYIGAFAVILGVFMSWRGYCSYLKEQLLFTKAFLDALKDYREKMKCYLKPLVAWAFEYSDEQLLSVGFLGAIREGKNVSLAYLESSEHCYLPNKVDSVLESLFSHLGEGYLETELENLDAAILKLDAEAKRMTDELSQRKKVAGSLLGALAVGVVILVI